MMSSKRNHVSSHVTSLNFFCSQPQAQNEQRGGNFVKIECKILKFNVCDYSSASAATRLHDVEGVSHHAPHKHSHLKNEFLIL